MMDTMGILDQRAFYAGEPVSNQDIFYSDHCEKELRNKT